jgi:hypothetical protein
MGMTGAVFLAHIATSANAATPLRGLSKVPARNVSAGYLNAIRMGTGTTSNKIASLNYDAVDIILLAFTGLNADASLDLTYGNSDIYRPWLIPQAHARSRSVLMSMNGDFPAATASAALRATAATNIANALDAYGYDGVDFDWEWPNTVDERANFTAFMQAVYATVKARSPDYIVTFVQGPGFWLAGTDWAAVAPYSDFCFMIVYDWKNPANGPIRKPGSVQFLGLNGGTIEAAGKGAIDYIIAQGYPANKIIAGLPFYSSDNRSWFNGAPLWITNRLGFLNAADPNFLETEIDGAWWTTPDNIKQKMSALLNARTTVLQNEAILRGIGFWELGHEDLAQPQVSDAVAEWRAGDRSLGGLASPPPAGSIVLVDTGSRWRFLDTGSAPGAAWKSNSFNDNAWLTGLAPLGYGDGDEATMVSYGPAATNKFITTYFRHAFTVANTSSLHALTLRLLRDDGAIVYLNGAEVFRSNMPTGAIAATLATNAVSGAEEATLFQIAALDPARLVDGTNLIAVEIHQSSVASTDLSFELQLLAHTEPARVALIPPRAVWRYLDAGTNPPATWKARTFDDSAWPEGRGRLGYGLDGELTTLPFGTNAAAKPITCYFRHAFTVAGDPALFGALRVNFQRDDGVVIYLNGTEVLRTNMATNTMSATNLALATVSGTDETNWLRAPLFTNALVSGLNVIAAEVHQVSANSTDLGFDLELTVALQPRLTITRSNLAHTLRWPAAAPGFRLQFSTNITAFNWSGQPGAPAVRGEFNELHLTNASTRFYRLVQP